MGGSIGPGVMALKEQGLIPSFFSHLPWQLAPYGVAILAYKARTAFMGWRSGVESKMGCYFMVAFGIWVLCPSHFHDFDS
jgi:hypothetical protein